MSGVKPVFTLPEEEDRRVPRFEPQTDLGRQLRDLRDEAAQQREQAVNSPSHYTQGRLEVIYQIEDALGPEGFRAYCIGNALKYLNRHRGKHGDEDVKKAAVYAQWAAHGLPAPANGRVPQ